MGSEWPASIHVLLLHEEIHTLHTREIQIPSSQNFFVALCHLIDTPPGHLTMILTTIIPPHIKKTGKRRE